MKNSQLINILNALSRKEVRDLRKWLQSPAHNQREDVIDLFDYLCDGKHLENDKALRKERIFQKIFPGETYDDAKIRQTIFFLQKCMEEYLCFQDFQRDPIRQQLALADVYRRKNLGRLFEKTMKTVEEEQETAPLRDENYFQNNYLIQALQYQFISEKTRTPDTNLQTFSDALDLRFIAAKLRLGSLVAAHQRVYKQELQVGLLDEVLAYVEKNDFFDHPPIIIYYFVYKALTDSTKEEYFFNLKEAVFKHSDRFSQEETRDIYLLAINYCISKMNLGVEKFIREAFELYKRAIENGALLDKGVLNHLAFRNIVTVGTTLKEFDWVSRFIQDYQQYLGPEYRENFVQFSLAKLHFEKGDYPQAQRLLMQFDYDDILINLSAKSMLIRIYYEEGEFSALESLLESLRTYINRKKVIAYHKNIYNNLIRYTKRLIRVTPYDREQKEKLRREIETANPLPERKWLLEQLDNL